MADVALTKDQKIRVIAAQICRYANGGCLCLEKEKVRMCNGPVEKASALYDLAREPEPRDAGSSSAANSSTTKARSRR